LIAVSDTHDRLDVDHCGLKHSGKISAVNRSIRPVG
jgi:hypothetical protein